MFSKILSVVMKVPCVSSVELLNAAVACIVLLVCNNGLHFLAKSQKDSAIMLYLLDLIN